MSEDKAKKRLYDIVEAPINVRPREKDASLCLSVRLSVCLFHRERAAS